MKVLLILLAIVVAILGWFMYGMNEKPAQTPETSTAPAAPAQTPAAPASAPADSASAPAAPAQTPAASAPAAPAQSPATPKAEDKKPVVMKIKG